MNVWRDITGLKSRWLLAQPVIPRAAELVWQDPVPGQAGLCEGRFDLVMMDMEGKGAAHRAHRSSRDGVLRDVLT